MDSKILLVMALTVIVSGCASQNKTASDIQKGKQALEEASESDTYAVKYTDAGFKPSSLIVREGDRVQWIDRSGEGLKITTSYSKSCGVKNGFASCTSVENFSHTFDEEGKITYHNPENPDHTGTVRVTRRNRY